MAEKKKSKKKSIVQQQYSKHNGENYLKPHQKNTN